MVSDLLTDEKPTDPPAEYRAAWKCLAGGYLTIEDGSFPTLEAAKAYAQLAEFDPGLGRRVVRVVPGSNGQLRYTHPWRIRLHRPPGVPLPGDHGYGRW